MELKQLITTKTFGEVKTLLNSTPYNLKIQEDNNIYMIKYDKDAIIDTNVGAECRGIILEKDTNKILSYSFNRKETPVDIKNYLDENWNNLIFEESIDGSQIRLFYYNDAWNIATTRCIQASNAFWYSNKSFETLFRECYDLDYDILNKNYCYSFVIRHSENRIVVNYSDNTLVHVQTRDMTTENYDIVEHDIGITKPVQIKFENSTDVLNMYHSSTRTDIEGIFVRNGDKHFKLYFESYMNIKRLRNNTRDMFFEYIENKVNGNAEEYTNIFSEYEYDINYYESTLTDLIRKIHRLYMEVHVEKTRLIKVVDKSFHKHLYNLHGIFIKNKCKITREVVKTFMYNLDAKQIMHLINIHYKNIDNTKE